MLSFLINYYRQSILLLFGGRLKLNKRLLVDIPSITKFIILWFWGLAEQNVLHLERFQSIDGSSWLLCFSGCCYCCCTLLDAIQSPDIADRVGLSTADKKNSANDEYKLRPACKQQRRCKETDSIRVLLSSVVQKIKLSSICSFVGSSKRMGQHGVHICGIKENIVTCSDGNLNLELVPSADWRLYCS